MYTLEQLQKKSLKELKEIGWELNVSPTDDRRCRENWVNAIAGVNPPLLELLETSPAEDVQAQESPIIETVEASGAAENVQAHEPPIESKFGRIVYPQPAKGAIVQVAKTSPGIESIELTQEAQKHKFLLCLKDGDNTFWYNGKDFVFEKWSAKTYCKRGVGAAKHQLRSHPEVKRARNVLEVVKNSPGVEVDPALEPISQVAETSPAADNVQAQEPPIESKFGGIVYPRPAQGAIVPAAETSPAVEVDPVQNAIKADITEFNNRFRAKSAGFCRPPRTYVTESVDAVEELLPKCAECFDDGFFEEESGFIKTCDCRSESKLSCQSVQSSIVPAIENFPSVDCVYCDSPEYESLRDESYRCYRCQPESDQNSILTGISLSDRFFARYTPPQSETLHYDTDGYKVEADGQLNLFSVQFQSPPEPPDPDDFESLDAFREAIARWDCEHPSCSDHCSDHLANSLEKEPPNPEDFGSMFAFWAAYDAWDKATDDDGEPSSIDKLPSSIDKPLEISLDSFIAWAPCPLDWYEPTAVMEHLRAGDSSDTSDFSIPTFGAWCDRANRQTDTDEPPDTGIFARLPKPKPPNFPPRAIGYTQPNRPLNAASRNYPETIPKLFHCSVAGSSNQPARSPPGGDANFA
jgi:hypothetical protein